MRPCVPGCALAAEDVFLRAELPRDLLRMLLLASQDVEALVAHALVRG